MFFQINFYFLGGFYMVKNNIKKIIQKRKISELELSEAIFVSYQSVNRWCNNKYQPNMDYAFSICEYLKVPIQEMFVYKKAE